jgi:hypothetical protein
MVYIRLFHGRTDPGKDMDDWGLDGPVFGPFEFVHTTYSLHVKCGKTDGNCFELHCFEDMLYYDGVYYGDWSVFTDDTFVSGKYNLTEFDKSKAQLP